MGHLTKNIKLRIDEETLVALEQAARDGDRTVAAEIRRAIRAHLAPAMFITLPDHLTAQEAEDLRREWTENRRNA